MPDAVVIGERNHEVRTSRGVSLQPFVVPVGVRSGTGQPSGAVCLIAWLAVGPSSVLSDESQRSIRVVQLHRVAVHNLPGARSTNFADPIEQAGSHSTSSDNDDVAKVKPGEDVRTPAGVRPLGETPQGDLAGDRRSATRCEMQEIGGRETDAQAGTQDGGIESRNSDRLGGDDRLRSFRSDV